MCLVLAAKCLIPRGSRRGLRFSPFAPAPLALWRRRHGASAPRSLGQPRAPARSLPAWPQGPGQHATWSSTRAPHRIACLVVVLSSRRRPAQGRDWCLGRSVRARRGCRAGHVWPTPESSTPVQRSFRSGAAPAPCLFVLATHATGSDPYKLDDGGPTAGRCLSALRLIATSADLFFARPTDTTPFSARTQIQPFRRAESRLALSIRCKVDSSASRHHLKRRHRLP